MEKDKRVMLPLYFDGESVTGKVQVRIKEGKKLEHQGVKIEFVGHIGNFVAFLNLYI